ncbi:MAG TPA: hypothetical protein VEY70_04350 [Metabacillus sp.]|nr:hypothetical protein [Metabacillus sp.]
MKLRNTLQTKYLILIICAMMILPIAFPLASFVVYIPAIIVNYNNIDVYDSEEVEADWHEKAKKLDGLSEAEMISSLKETATRYKTSTVFWVDKNGETRYVSNKSSQIPEKWTPIFTVSFMKESYGGDPFTIVSFIGEEKTNGFIVLQIDREYMDYPIQQLENYFEIIYVVVVGLLLLLFIVLSWLFFKSIRKRIVRLQKQWILKINEFQIK